MVPGTVFGLTIWSRMLYIIKMENVMDKNSFEKEAQEFIREIDVGKFKLEVIPNTARDYRDVDKRDLDAFSNYLNSDSFKILNNEASK
jgi:hypothetical protein